MNKEEAKSKIFEKLILSCAASIIISLLLFSVNFHKEQDKFIRENANVLLSHYKESFENYVSAISDTRNKIDRNSRLLEEDEALSDAVIAARQPISTAVGAFKDSGKLGEKLSECEEVHQKIRAYDIPSLDLEEKTKIVNELTDCIHESLQLYANFLTQKAAKTYKDLTDFSVWDVIIRPDFLTLVAFSALLLLAIAYIYWQSPDSDA